MCLSTLFQQDVYKTLSRTKSASPHPSENRSSFDHQTLQFQCHDIFTKTPKTTNTTVQLHVTAFCQDNFPFLLEGQKCDLSKSSLRQMESILHLNGHPKKRLKVGDRGHPWHKLSLLLQDKSMAHWETPSCHTVGRNPTPVESSKKKRKIRSGYSHLSSVAGFVLHSQYGGIIT